MSLQSSIAVAALLATGACAGFQADRARDGGGTSPGVGRDVEAPEILALTEPGIWDGRASLGGVWALHPAPEGPLRVLMRNPENGRSVVGALFRRAPDAQGPALRLSGDAAAALGLAPRAPAMLSVVAITRAEDAAALGSRRGVLAGLWARRPFARGGRAAATRNGGPRIAGFFDAPVAVE